MACRLRSASESTPVSDYAVSQGDRTMASRGRKRRSSDPQATREEAGYPGQNKSRCLSRASSRPGGRCGNAPSQVLPLAKPAPLGRQHPPRTKSQLHPFPRARTIRDPITTNRLPLELSSHGSDSSGVDVALAGPSPQWTEEEKPFAFFDFPAEVRNIIYDHVLHWPSCADLYRCFYRQLRTYPKSDQPYSSQYQKDFKTPTILLLCRRITRESLPMLRSQCLVVDRLPPFLPRGLMKLTEFIGQRTLQNLHHIDLRIGLGEGPLGSGWLWIRLLDDLLAVLGQRNAFVTLRLLLRMCDRGFTARWDQEKKYSEEIRKKLQIFKKSNPNVFAPGEIIVEAWEIENQRAVFVNRYPIFGDEDTSPPPDRLYPDREMFPGSIMQFVEGLPAPLWGAEEIARRLGYD